MPLFLWTCGEAELPGREGAVGHSSGKQTDEKDGSGDKVHFLMTCFRSLLPPTMPHCLDLFIYQLTHQQTDPPTKSGFSCSSNPSRAHQLAVKHTSLNAKENDLFIFTSCVYVCVFRSEEDVRSPGAGAMGGCEPPCGC